MKNRNSYIEKWKRALESYGTPVDFADGTVIDIVSNPMNDDNISFRLFQTNGYVNRFDLMKKQKEKSKLTLVSPWPNYGDNCFLCDNVGQASVNGSNLILPWAEFENEILVPNRYPLVQKHSLLLSKQHNKKQIGNFTNQYLDSLMKICSDYDLFANQNHPKAGMSIPNHQHCHLMRGIIESRDGRFYTNSTLTQSTLLPTEYDSSVFKPKESHFDTLAFKNPEIFMSTIDSLESDDKMFTFTYYDETFFMTPHLLSKGYAGEPEYAKVLLPSEYFKYDCHIKKLSEYLPLKGSFDWEKYF
jgi:hypothetical protein